MAISCEEIKNLLDSAFSSAQTEVVGGEGKYQVTMVSAIFDGLNRVKRQQTVYKVLNPHISTGAIHAVSMILNTPQEVAGANH